MNIKFSFIENIINLDFQRVMTLEIENHSYFYRVVKNFVDISNGNILDDIYVFDENNEEINISSKINVIFDYFNFDILYKQYNTLLNKYIASLVDDSSNNQLSNIYKKIKLHFSKITSETDLPIIFKEEYNVIDC